MTKYDLSLIKDNNPYKEQCEHIEESLNEKSFKNILFTNNYFLIK